MSLDYDNMAALQENDPDIQAYRTAITGLRFQDIPVPGSNRTLLCDVSKHTPRPIVPKSLRRLVFDTVHNLAHPGVKPTQQLITQRFVWHGINKNIASWVRSCSACQLSNATQSLPSNSLYSPKVALTASMSTSWVHFPSHTATATSSQSSTASPAGQKPFPWSI